MSSKPVSPAQAPLLFNETKDAIARADEHAEPGWRDRAYEVGCILAHRHLLFTSADIDLEMQKQFPEIQTHEKRAMGAVVLRLIRDEVIEKTVQFIKDPRPNCHNQNKNVLRSRVYKAA